MIQSSVHDVAPSTPRGLVAVDKQGGRVLFLDPSDYRTLQVLDGFPRLPHELAISPAGDKAYVPIYGDGIHGNNPHPQHLVSVIDLIERRRLPDIDIAPHEAPHSGVFGPDGSFYLCCENSADIAIINPRDDRLIGSIPTGSRRSHRLALLPGPPRLVTDNEEDASVSVLDIGERRLLQRVKLPEPIAGIAASPDGRHLVLSSAKGPRLHLLDGASFAYRGSLPLAEHEHGLQVLRYRADGGVLLAVGDGEPVISLLDEDFTVCWTLRVGRKPMDAAFHPDRRHLLVANEGEGTLSVIDTRRGEVVDTVEAGEGCETLGFF